MNSEVFILNFFQLPKEVEIELRLIAAANGLTWLDYLNELYEEFVPP